MAKTTERKAAKEFYIKGKEQKEIARLVGVAEKTISQWVIKYGWKSERDARLNGSKNRINAIKEVIGKLTDQRLSLFDQAKKAEDSGDKEQSLALSKQAASIADEISKYNKTLENLDDKNRMSLSTYLEVLDDIFNAMHRKHPKIYIELLEFQEEHLSHISSKYN
jgi:predicted transcriptional regulator